MTANWMEQNKALFHALRLERLVTFITIGLIVFVAALNILISLTMMVMEKTKDIAVLMSMGTRRSQVRRLFIAQGVVIGAFGTVIGLLLGYVLSWIGGHYHLISLSPEVYSIDYVPFAPRAGDGVCPLYRPCTHHGPPPGFCRRKLCGTNKAILDGPCRPFAFRFAWQFVFRDSFFYGAHTYVPL